MHEEVFACIRDVQDRTKGSKAKAVETCSPGCA